MAKNNKAFNKEFYEKHFRITIFGSARIKKDDKIYKQVFNLAKDLGKQGFDVITGGGPGLMEAANAGHGAGDTKNKAHSIGLNIKLPFEEQGNRHLEIKREFDRFSNRLDHFMILSNVVIVMPGGVGTCLEFFYAWQLTQVKHICNIPIILCGKMWQELIEWVTKFPIKQGLINKSDLHNLYIVQSNKEALDLIKKSHKIYKKEGDKYCLNINKYTLDKSQLKL